MVNSSLSYFNIIVNNIAIAISLIIIVYLIKLLILNTNLKYKLAVNYVNIVQNVLNTVLYCLYFVLMLHTLFLYFNYDFNLKSVNYFNELVNYHYKNMDTYRMTYMFKSKNSSNSYHIEYLQELFGILSMLIIAYYRAFSILIVAPFPGIFKAFLGALISILIRIVCFNLLDLFNRNNQFFCSSGYTFEGLFYLYNLSIKYMLFTIVLIFILLLVEHYLSNYIAKSSFNKNEPFFIELKGKFFSFNHLKTILLNTKTCFSYFKYEILLVMVKSLTALNHFIYLNCFAFLLLHSFPTNIINLLSI